MALGENPTLKEIVDETERLNSAIIGTIKPNFGNYVSGHYMTGEITVGDYSGTGGNCVYFSIPNKHYLKDVNWIMSSCPDLRPENIINGKNILGVVGNASIGFNIRASDEIATNQGEYAYQSLYGAQVMGTTLGKSVRTYCPGNGSIRFQFNVTSGSDNYWAYGVIRVYRGSQLIYSSEEYRGIGSPGSQYRIDVGGVKAGDALEVWTRSERSSVYGRISSFVCFFSYV